MEPIDILPWIRENAQMFMGPSGPSAWKLMEGLTGGALALGCTHVEASRTGDWYVISANADWFNLPCNVPADENDIFVRLYSFPEYGVNCHRGEVLLSAFCDDVVTCASERCKLVQGTVDAGDCIWQTIKSNPKWRRVVAFRGVRT